MALTIRDAAPADAATILRFVQDLAEYEKLADEAKMTLADVRAHFFGPAPRVFCQIAEADGGPVGFAVWFYNFSTFRGRHGIWLEDLFVTPAARGQGAGLALLASLAQRCVTEGLARLEWSVLDWNAPSIAFYEQLGSVAMDEWTTRRLDGDALARLAAVPDKTDG